MKMTLFNNRNIFRMPFNIKGIITALIIIFAAVSCKKSTCANGTLPKDCNSGMDVAFVIDYTGSMGGVIDSIKANLSGIVAAINTKSGGNYRLSLGIFDEQQRGIPPLYASQTTYTSLPAANKIIINNGPVVPGTTRFTDQYLTMMETFPVGTGNGASFIAQANKLNIPGSMNLGSGIGGPEPGGLLTDKIVNSGFAGTWRSGVTKLCIIITDAPDGGNDDFANTIDDTFLQALATAGNTQSINFLLISSQSSTASNYSTQLIHNNSGGIEFMNADLKKIGLHINNVISSVCK